MEQPLDGYRILDMTEVWAGPMGATFLGDLGAEVIRLESFPRSTITRPAQAPVGMASARSGVRRDSARPWDVSPTYHLANRNKLGIAMNVMHPRGRVLFEQLVSLCDAFLIGFSAGTIERMRLDYETLRKLRPDLVMVSMPGWGERGPYEGYATLGSGLDAFAGHLQLRGYPDMDVTSAKTAVFHSDATGALALAFAVLTGLYHRDRSGKGQFIDLSQAEVLLTHLARPVIDWSMNRRAPKPVGNSDPEVCPHGCFPCRNEDTWVVIVARTDDQWRSLVKAMGEPGWAANPRYDLQVGRILERLKVEQGIADWTRSITQGEVTSRLRGSGVTVGPVYDLAELVGDEQLLQRDFWIDVDHPPADPYKRAGFAWRLTGTPSRLTLPPNNLGEHNHKVLCDLLRVSESEFNELVDQGVIGDAYRPGSEVHGT